MSADARIRSYWREEFALLTLLLVFFIGIVGFSYNTPFDARLFPVVIGVAGIGLTLLIAVEQVRLRRIDAGAAVDSNDPAARVDWPRFATALLSAPAFGLAFWLLGFVVASLGAMLLMPVLMGYRNRRRLVVIAVITVAVLALFARRHGYPLISLVIGLILGKLAEGSFHQALMISDHDYSVFFLRPLSAIIFATCLVLILWPGVKRRLGHGGAEVT